MTKITSADIQLIRHTANYIHLRTFNKLGKYYPKELIGGLEELANRLEKEWADGTDKPTIEEVRKAFLPETVEKLGWQDFREYNHASNYRNELILANKIDELIQVYGERLEELEGKK